MASQHYTPLSGELGETARDYTLRMVQLTSRAATSNVTREFRTALHWMNQGLAFLRNTAGQDDPQEIWSAQQELAEECRDQMVQDVRNVMQIAELTKEELLHWQERWTQALIRTTFRG